MLTLSLNVDKLEFVVDILLFNKVSLSVISFLILSIFSLDKVILLSISDILLVNVPTFCSLFSTFDFNRLNCVTSTVVSLDEFSRILDKEFSTFLIFVLIVSIELLFSNDFILTTSIFSSAVLILFSNSVSLSLKSFKLISFVVNFVSYSTFLSFKDFKSFSIVVNFSLLVMFFFISSILAFNS